MGVQEPEPARGLATLVARRRPEPWAGQKWSRAAERGVSHGGEGDRPQAEQHEAQAAGRCSSSGQLGGSLLTEAAPVSTTAKEKTSLVSMRLETAQSRRARD